MNHPEKGICLNVVNESCIKNRLVTENESRTKNQSNGTIESVKDNHLYILNESMTKIIQNCRMNRLL